MNAKLSKRDVYATILTVELALNRNGKPVALKDVARRHGLSKKYIWTVASMLVRGGLLEAARGATGGFRLAHPARSITFDDIFRACEGKEEPPASVRVSRDPAVQRVLTELWREVADIWHATLSKVTVQQLVERYEALSRPPELDFQI